MGEGNVDETALTLLLGNIFTQHPPQAVKENETLGGSGSSPRKGAPWGRRSPKIGEFLLALLCMNGGD